MAKERVERDEEDLVRLYLTDIGQYPLLTKEDEVRLAQAIEAGAEARAEFESVDTELTPAKKRELRRAMQKGEQAERTFVQSNLRLVVSIAKKYQASGLPLLDLIQEGNLGLMHAVEKFDWRKGFKFSTYATWWIRQAITRGLGNHGRTIRLPVHMVDIVRTVQETRQQLLEDLGRVPTVEEIAELSCLDPSRVELALHAPSDTVSLDRPVGDEGDARLQDLIQDDDAVDPFDATALALRRDYLMKAMGSLEDDEKVVLVLRYGLDDARPRTLAEVGEELDLTREMVRQIERRAVSKLRHPSNLLALEELI